jgi:hypothetical protein
MQKYTNGSRRAITGASLAQLVRRMPATARACLAANVIDGRIALVDLTAKAIITIVGANSSYVYQALRLSQEQREQVCRGERSLIAPAPVNTHTRPIDWDAVDDLTLVEVISRIGVNRVVDAAVAAEQLAS